MANTFDALTTQSQTLTDATMAGAEFQVQAGARAQQLSDQATEDALWRMAQNNAMARLKGLNKLAESANQMS